MRYEGSLQVGQATVITHWAFEDGSEGGPAVAEVVESAERPTDEEIRKAGESPSHGFIVSQAPTTLLPASLLE